MRKQNKINHFLSPAIECIDIFQLLTEKHHYFLRTRGFVDGLQEAFGVKIHPVNEREPAPCERQDQAEIQTLRSLLQLHLQTSRPDREKWVEITSLTKQVNVLVSE